MIAVVLLLIIVVGATIVMGGGDEKASSNVADTETKGSSDKDAEKEDKSVSLDEDKKSEEKDNEDKKEEEKKSDEEKQEDKASDEEDTVALEGEDQSELKVEDSDEPNVKKTMVHPDWKPVGTEQTGEHVSVYDEGTVDWQEKIKATSYATGIPEDNMTVWWMEGNGGPQKSMATVTAKDTKTPYRVYLQWVDGKGWQPTKVQELVENDKD